MKNMENKQVPDAVFKTRVQNEKGSYDWRDVISHEIFKGKK